MALIDKLNSIGDAIRSKTGKEDKLTLEQMVTEIEGISGGGSGNEDYVALIGGTLVDFVAPEGATTIKPELFYEDKVIKTADLRNVTNIGNFAFQKSSLESVILSDNTTRIGGSAFNSSQITEVNNSVMAINITSGTTRIFGDCTKLKDVYLPNCLIYGALYLFNNCTALERVVMQAHSIRSDSFNSCESLTALVLHNYRDTVATLDGVTGFANTPIANGTGYIYVPKALIEKYKLATNWITFAEQFRAIEDYPEICGGAENG